MKKGLFRVFILFFILTASLLIVTPQIGLSSANQWIYLGPQATNVSIVVVDPHNSSTLFAGTFYQGIHKSVDSGMSWSVSPLINSFTSIGFDPNIPGIIYALAYYHFYKSMDAGNNWTSYSHPDANCMVHDPVLSSVLYLGAYKPIPASPGGVFRSVDGGNSWNALGLTDYDVGALAIDPSNRNVIYAATRDAGIFKSEDGGLTWGNINPVLNRVHPNALKVDSHSPMTVYVGTGGTGIFKSTDGGMTWNSINSGLSHLYILSLAIDPNSFSTLYAGTVGGGVFVTKNGGIFWMPVNDGLPINDIFSISALAIKKDFPMTLYAGAQTVGLTPKPTAGVYALVIEKSPKEKIDDLITEVERMVTSGLINRGQGNALKSKLDAALKSIERGENRVACNQLKAFINSVYAFVRSGIISRKDGQMIIDASEKIIRELSI